MYVMNNSEYSQSSAYPVGHVSPSGCAHPCQAALLIGHVGSRDSFIAFFRARRGFLSFSSPAEIVFLNTFFSHDADIKIASTCIPSQYALVLLVVQDR